MSARDLADWRRTQAQLAALFGQDLRSPLGVLSTNLSFLAQSADPADTDTAAVYDELAVSCEEFLRMVENLEAIGELAHGEPAEVPTGETDLGAVARSAIERTRAVAALSGVSLAVEAPAAPVLVRANAARLDLLVRNLASNGVTWARRGHTATVTVDYDDHGAPRLGLRDPGPTFGDPATAFARETQAQIKHTRAGRYSRGLGPYLIGLVARSLHATLGVGHDGHTSTLTITFPRA